LAQLAATDPDRFFNETEKVFGKDFGLLAFEAMRQSGEFDKVSIEKMRLTTEAALRRVNPNVAGVRSIETVETDIESERQAPYSPFEILPGFGAVTIAPTLRVLTDRHNTDRGAMKDSADRGATQDMRGALDEVPMHAVADNAEGRRDEASTLPRDKMVGGMARPIFRNAVTRLRASLSVDTIELTAGMGKDEVQGTNSIASVTERGGVLRVIDTYGDIIVYIKGLRRKGVKVDLNASPEKTLKSVADSLKMSVDMVNTACIFRDRNRHYLEAAWKAKFKRKYKNFDAVWLVLSGFIDEDRDNLRKGLEGLWKRKITDEELTAIEVSISHAVETGEPLKLKNLPEVKFIGRRLVNIKGLYTFKDGSLLPVLSLARDLKTEGPHLLWGIGGSPEMVIQAGMAQALGLEYEARIAPHSIWSEAQKGDFEPGDMGRFTLGEMIELAEDETVITHPDIVEVVTDLSLGVEEKRQAIADIVRRLLGEHRDSLSRRGFSTDSFEEDESKITLLAAMIARRNQAVSWDTVYSSDSPDETKRLSRGNV
ncbi:MAG: fructose-bisphosphatase class II, partial [Candidatus Omnitrophota bacterium]|nr:fructose-bisphosphatase class II [Candidatus Omnitrophota bacterium]